MKKDYSSYLHVFVLIIVIFALIGCSSVRKTKSSTPTVAKPAPTMSKQVVNRNKFQPRPRISTTSNRYEGSLWRDESSFGNLLRDHRARFRHDLLTINGLSSIITVPPPKEPVEDQPADNIVQQASAALEALTLRDTLEEERNDIMRSLESISAVVTRVLPNGNMQIKGRKITLRQQNQVRYVTTVTGLLRPADVDDTNVVSASKLVYPEIKTKRQVLGSLLRSRLGKLAPLLGKQNAGLLERLSDFTKSK